MSHPRRIYFLAGDYSGPSGGIRVLYRHVELLRRNSIEAFVVHQRSGFRLSWFDSDAPVSSLADIRASEHDFVIVPENYRRAPVLFPKPRKILFCQSFFYAFKGFAGTSNWRSWCTEMASVSKMITEFIHKALHFEGVSHWPVYIDTTLFHPRRKRLQICYMPRKRRDEARFIQAMFAARHPHLAKIPWVRIAGASEETTARIMGESAVFLALGRHEGLGLPPIEAMASGCLVAGFHGGGGLEYARSDNGLWVADGDLFACVDTLAEAVERWEDPSIHRAAAATAGEYRRERTEKTLLDFWGRRLAQPVS